MTTLADRLLPDGLWQRILPLLPPPPSRVRGLIAGMAVALAGCQVTASRQDVGTADTSQPITITTVAPPTSAERAWVASLAKLRRRLDRTIQVGMTITHAKVDELYDTYRTCRPGVLKLEASPRLAEARQRALRACRDYEAAGPGVPQDPRLSGHAQRAGRGPAE
jgi:hypothetical protein